MERISKAFAQRKKCITLYLTLGYPNVEEFLEAVDILAEEDTDILELGVPVENPCLDGEVIACSYLKVLNNGFSEKLLEKILLEIRNRHPQLPVVLMSYYEGVERYNLRKYSKYYDALLCSDKVLDFKKYNIPLIQMYNEQLSDEDIMKRISTNQGFAYVMSGVGKTGGQGELPKAYIETMKRVRLYSNIPMQIGFAINNSEQVKEVLNNGADGAIIGTQVIRKLNEGSHALREYVRELCKTRVK